MLENLRSVLPNLFKDLRGLFDNPQAVIDFIRHYLLYLLWLLLVPIMLYTMAQGRELFTGLFDDHTFFTAFRAAMLLGIFFVQAMVVLLLPRPFFRGNTLAGGTLPRGAQVYDYQPSDWERFRPGAVTNPGIQYVLSVLPALVYGLVMIAVQRDRVPGYGWPLIVLALAGAVFAAYWFEEKWPKGFRTTLFWTLGNMALCMGLILVVPSDAHRFWNYFITGTCLMFQMALIGGLSRRLNENLRHIIATNRWQLGGYDRLYLFVFIFLVGFVIIGAIVPNVEPVSPTFILLALTSFYLLISTLIAAVYRYRVDGGPKWRAWVFWGTLLVAATFVFKLGAPIHDIKTMAQDIKPSQRDSFDTWFQKWAAGLDTTQQEIPIYLVAAQGGGSRAGLWASEILNRLEVESNYRFHRHCLAITSASGGSAGTGATLAFWRYVQDTKNDWTEIAREMQAPTKGGPNPSDSLRRLLHLRFSEGFFQRNYLSNSFFDLFITEVGTSFLAFSKSRFDRNYGHQKSEALGLAAGIRRGLLGPQNTEFSDVWYRMRSLFYQGDKERLHIQGKAYMHNYAFDSYLSYWYNEGKAQTEWPLYFPITTNVHTGQCGYPSPVKVERNLFSDAVDVLHAVDSAYQGQTLSMVGATNLSQLFPVMNAFTFIPHSGNYLDGGVFENMGLPLIQSLCRRVDSLTQTMRPSIRNKIKIKLIYIINNSATYSKVVEYPAIKRKFQPTMLISFMGGAAMSGRTRHFIKNNEYSLPKSVEIIPFVLQYPHPQTRDTIQIPLGRWLSKRSIRTMEARADTLLPEIRRAVGKQHGN